MRTSTPRSVSVLVTFLLCACSSGPRVQPASVTPPTDEAREPQARTPEPQAPTPTDARRAAFVATDGSPPLQRALVALETLLDGATFVGPSSPRPDGASDATLRLLHEPRETYRDGHRELVFFALVDGVVTEVHVDARTGALETMPLASIAAMASEPTCEAPTHCGCFSTCVEVVRLGPDGPDARYRELGTEGGAVLRRRAQCYEGSCARVCDAPGHCVDALEPLEETCTGACAPAEASFHCVHGPTGCDRVEH